MPDIMAQMLVTAGAGDKKSQPAALQNDGVAQVST
jgi:hypothetical protein